MRSPSGDQFSIRWRDQLATVVCVGGGLREYEVAGEPVLDGYSVHEMCSAGRGQPLIPWPNRLRDGSYEFAGRRYQLPLTEPDKHNAIHGLVRWSKWTPGELEPDCITMTHTLFPQPGYPHLLDVAIMYELSALGLRVELLVRNQGDRVAPLGAGQHPYLLPGGQRLDECELVLPADCYLETDERQIPAGRAGVAGTGYDFRSGRPIGSTRLDTAFGDLHRDPDGVCSLYLSGGQRRVRLWLDEQFRYVMAFTGDSLPDPAARRRSLGIEPMSCPPNALQTGDGLAYLGPGEFWRASWGIQVE